jgi:hypothetical protein
MLATRDMARSLGKSGCDVNRRCRCTVMAGQCHGRLILRQAQDEVLLLEDAAKKLSSCCACRSTKVGNATEVRDSGTVDPGLRRGDDIR